MFLGATQVTGCQWSGDPAAVLWPANGRTEFVGAIGLRDCVITNCRFYCVGLLVPDDHTATVRPGFGLA